MRFEYKHRHETYQALLRWPYRTRVSNFVRGNQDVSSMFVSTSTLCRNNISNLHRNNDNAELIWKCAWLICSVEWTESRLWLPTITKIDTTPSRRSRQTAKRAHSQTSCRFGWSSLFNAQVKRKATNCPKHEPMILHSFLCSCVIIFYRSPSGSSSFNSYAGQLAVSVQDGNAQWPEDDYQRGQSSSVSPRGGYCSSASTPHSSGGGSYGNGATNSYGSNVNALSSPSSSVFNSTSSKFYFYP